MAQQINLYNPILLTPKRYFSTLAIVQALGLLVAGLAAFSCWSTWSTWRLERDLAAASAVNEAEKALLTGQLAQRPVLPTNTAALEQQLQQAKALLADRRAVFDALDSQHGGAGHAQADLLRHLAQTVPAAVWLTEVRRTEGRLEIAGATLQPEQLQPWLARLVAHPGLAGQALRAVAVVRSEDALPGSEAWTFRIVSAQEQGAMR